MQNEEITKMVQENIRRESENAGKVVFEGLLDDSVINRLPESIFVEYFLPKFSGVDQTKKETWTSEWLSIAGTPMAEVIVFADDTKEELFRVPALLQSDSLIMEKQEGDIGDIFTRYNQIHANVPQSALSFLIQALNSKNKELLSKFNNTDVVKRWMDILSRYGYIQRSVPGGNELQVTQEQDLTDAFDF